VAHSTNSGRPMLRIPRRRACVDCHFFVNEITANAGKHSRYHVTAGHRRLARDRDFSWVKDHTVICCDFGVWDSGYGLPDSDRTSTIVDTDRTNQCFFWPYCPGMLIPAGRTLQQREAAAKESSRDRRLTIWGLWIAAVALVVNAVLQLGELFKWWSVGR
jgi:hypothetical protein